MLRAFLALALVATLTPSALACCPHPFTHVEDGGLIFPHEVRRYDLGFTYELNVLVEITSTPHHGALEWRLLDAATEIPYAEGVAHEIPYGFPVPSPALDSILEVENDSGAGRVFTLVATVV